MGEFVRVEHDGAIATIRLDRPPMNALTGQGQDELAAAAADVGADPGVRAVVIYGGEKVFAAGVDIKEMADAGYPRMAADSRRLQAAFTAVAKIPKPVVAAVNGYALGGGLELALCADFRVAGQSARLGQPEILLGIIPGAGGTQRLPRLIGPARSSPTRRPTGPRATWWLATQRARRWPCGPRNRRSTTAWKPTSTPAWRSSGCTSRDCSRPRISARECAVSLRMGPGRPPSRAADIAGSDLPVRLNRPGAARKEQQNPCIRPKR
jgi:hypothetical protein